MDADSPLVTWSGWLFVAAGAFQLLIGILTPLAMRMGWGSGAPFLAYDADSAAFGRDAQAWMQEPGMRAYRDTVLAAVGSVLILAGGLQAAVGWFAWREGQSWAFASIAILGAATIASWLLVLGPYFRGGASLTIATIPPFMWLYVLLWVPGVALGATALSRSSA